MELILEKLSLAEWETNKDRFEYLKRENKRLTDETGRQLFRISELQNEIKQLKAELKLKKEQLGEVVETPQIDKFLRAVETDPRVLSILKDVYSTLL